jgi:hypothetical protein
MRHPGPSVLASLLGLAPAAARGEAPPRVPVQGVLTDQAGVPVDGPLEVSFSLYAAEAGGAPLWADAEVVVFDAGAFSTHLGAGEPLPLSLFRDHGSLWLGIAVDGDEEMGRLPIGTAPYAAFAQFAGDAATLGGLRPEAFARAAHDTPWASVTGVPPDLADGDDVGEVRAAPEGGVDVGPDGNVGLASRCAPGEILKRTPAGWDCAPDDTGAAGGDPDAGDDFLFSFGLEGTTLSVTDGGGTYEVDLGVLQEGFIEADADPTNELLTRVGFDVATRTLHVEDAGGVHTVDLSALVSVDADGDSGNELLVSASLDGRTLRLIDAGGAFAVDLSSLVAGLDGDAANELNTSVALNGTVLEITDAGGTQSIDLAPLRDGDTQYTAGAGLLLDGTRFDVDTDAMQARIVGSCPPGAAIRAVDAAGNVTCHVDVAQASPFVPRPNEIVTLDTEGDVGAGTSLAIGADGLPVIAYQDATNQDLKVLKCGNLGCSAGNVVTTIDAAAQVGDVTSIAIAPDGFPVIAYYEAGRQDLKVAKCADPACRAGTAVTTIDGDGADVGRSASLAIGSDGLPIIAYLDMTHVDVRVAKCATPACDGQAVITRIWHPGMGAGAGSDYRGGVAIGIEGDTGLPVVALGETKGQLEQTHVVFCRDHGCTVTLRTHAIPYASLDVNLVVGHHGQPYFFAQSRTRTWSVYRRSTTLVEIGQQGEATPATPSSMAVTQAGVLLMAFDRPATSELVVTVLHPPVDQREYFGSRVVIDVDGGHPSIAVGVDGLPIVAYQDTSTRDLKLARATNPLFRPYWVPR